MGGVRWKYPGTHHKLTVRFCSGRSWVAFKGVPYNVNDWLWFDSQ